MNYPNTAEGNRAWVRAKARERFSEDELMAIELDALTIIEFRREMDRHGSRDNRNA